MKQFANAMVLLCSLFALVVMIPEAKAADPASNIIQYIPEEDWNDPPLPQSEKQEMAHTIYWLSGITPPRMPHEITDIPGRSDAPSIGDFTLLEETSGSGTVTHRYYASPYYPGNGWYDLNKYVSQNGSGLDSHLCFAVSMTNMLHWWLDQNRDYIDIYLAGLPDEKRDILTNYVENHLENGLKSQPVLQHPSTSRLYNDAILPLYTGATSGGWPDKPADYLINGYRPDKDIMSRNKPSTFPAAPMENGGLFYDVFGKSILTDHLPNGHYDVLERDLKTYMSTGTAVVIGYNILGGSHAVSLWGAEYDENHQLCAIYMTDNNDNDGNGALIDGQLISMIRYDIYKSSNGPAAYFTTSVNKSGNNIINSYYPLTLAREGWEHWKNHKTPMYETGRAFLNPIPSENCSHTYSYSAHGGQIIRTCPQCGDSMYIYMRLSTQNGQRVYTGAPIKPLVKISSTSTYPFNTSDIWYDNNINAGIATGYMSAKIDGVVYTAKQDFEILPQKEAAPAEGPILLKKTAYTIELAAQSGFEYSLDGTHWQTDGLFAGLDPATEYTVQIRKQPRNDTGNYAPSDPGSQTLTVTTEDGEQLGDPEWSIRSLKDGQVTIVNTGSHDRVTVIIAGYDTSGRQTYVHTESVSGSVGQPITVHFTDDSALKKVFLIDSQNHPVCQSYPAK